MDKEKLKSWLNIEENMMFIQMPNEIFDDFNKAEFSSFNHKCFAYAYYYICCYLYRNALYGTNTDRYSQQNIIKLFVSNKTMVSYITKANGLLDQIKYTRTTTDYPISAYMCDGLLEFGMVKELRKKMVGVEINHSPRFSIKEPIKALIRFDDEDFTGTFYSYQNTHKIDIKRFIEIITDKELGHVGLFIYGYFSMMCDRFPNGFQITVLELSEIVGCSERTIKKYVARLEEVGMLDSTRRTYDSKLLQKVYSIK